MDKQTQAVINIDPEQLPNSLPEPILNIKSPIPIESIIALRKKQLSMSQIAKILGCSKPNIVMRLKKIGYEVDSLNNFKEAKADILELELKRNIQSITDADRKKASYYNKVVSIGILIDKIQLLTGKATSNIFFADLIKANQINDLQIQEAEVIDNMSGNEGKTGI